MGAIYNENSSNQIMNSSYPPSNWLRLGLLWITICDKGVYIVRCRHFSKNCIFETLLQCPQCSCLDIISRSEFFSESRFESPISISKLNNYSDFGRKSENYFNVKIFSDSRPKSAQNLILKVFPDSRTQIICRLSEFLKNKIRRYTWLRVG